MINRLRRRFIIITMIAVVLVLAAIISSINIVNYDKISTYADKILKSIATSGGEFPEFSASTDGGEQDTPPRINDFTAETAFETRFFTVEYNNAGEVTTVNVRNVATVDEDEAQAIAETVVNRRRTSGYVNLFRYLTVETTSGTMVLCMDCSRLLSTAQEFLYASVMISIVGILAVLIIVVVLSKHAMEPIAESYDKQRRFITDASHELKTPLTIISANNEIIEMEFGESDSTKSISKQITRMTNMTNNLTMLAKMDETSMEGNRSQFSLSDAAIDVCEPYYKLANASGKKFNTVIADNISFTGDEKLIRQMFTLMLDNAVKYGKSRINVSMTQNKSHINIELRNDAENLEEGNLDKYFGRFYRSDETRASGIEGSGIGLSIVQEIVDLHKGRITAVGEKGDFIIRIIF